MKLDVIGLRKDYGNKHALKGINLSLSDGVYGFLGPNGAGKSTFMNILTGNIRATAGDILLDGRNIMDMGRDFRAMLGYMPQQQALYPDLTAAAFLSYMAALRGMSSVHAKERINTVLERVGLSGNAHDKIRSFSGGMKQRLLIAQAILDDPAVLVLDEPTAGLDPKQRISIRNLISEISEGKIVIIATHVVSDVEAIANRILLINEGELLADSTREELTACLNGRVWEIEVPADRSKGFNSDGSFLVGSISREGSVLYVRIITDNEPVGFECRPVRPDLEDVYLYYFRQ